LDATCITDFREGRGGRDAGLGHGTGLGLGCLLGAADRESGIRAAGCGVEDMAAKAPGWRRGSSPEAVGLWAQGFTRDDRSGEDGCGGASLVVRSHASLIAVSYRPVEGDG
jgi:hypothetical protein